MPKKEIVIIKNKIYTVRNKKVMLDRDLAELYEVETKTFNRSVKRNKNRFPEDFMFQLTKDEYDSLRYQTGTLKRGAHSKYLPNVFTEQGLAMLSGVLNSERAVNVNISIMRAFTKMREAVMDYADLSKKIQAMERQYDSQFKMVFDTLRNLLSLKEEKPKKIKEPKKTKKIGFGRKDKQ